MEFLYSHEPGLGCVPSLKDMLYNVLWRKGYRRPAEAT